MSAASAATLSKYSRYRARQKLALQESIKKMSPHELQQYKKSEIERKRKQAQQKKDQRAAKRAKQVWSAVRIHACVFTGAAFSVADSATEIAGITDSPTS